MIGHCFISYSNADGLDFATRLVNELEGVHPFISTWFDKKNMTSSGGDWDDQIASAIKRSMCLLFVMSVDSTAENSNCKDEWAWALKYKKPVICLLLDKKAEDQYRLNSRQKVDFSSNFDAGMAQLRTAIARLDTVDGALDQLRHRLADANRDLRRSTGDEKSRIESEVEELTTQIRTQEKIASNPKAAEAQTRKNIEAGLERERQPEKPVAAKLSTKFINPPPGIAPNYFQDRIIETKQVYDLINEPSQRLMTIVGRGGVGKTAMVCRLLKGLESGELPDGLGTMRVDGIVYLSESGSHRVNFANIFYDLCKLLPADTANELDAVYKNPQGSTESKMRAVLEKFTDGRVALLLDNFEPLVDTETFAIRDAELDEALRAFLNGTHTAVNIVITTRIAPKPLNLIQPGRQRVLTLDEGLESPYAENILREMDSDGRMGLKSAPADLLSRARERTRGYPRALESLFAILASDRYTTLEELLAMPTPENVVEALVGEAFNRLDVNAQKVMQALAVYNRPVTPAAVDYLLAPHLPAIDSAPILQRLANMHFSRKESGRFYLHPVDREFAFGLIADDERGKKKEENKSSELPITNYELRFTQHALTRRAADYFRQARKPRAEWKKLDDLAAQLAEFDLRYAAGDYDTAVSVLMEIDHDYFFLWGHYYLAIDLHKRLLGKIENSELKQRSVGRLGLANHYIGQLRLAIFYEETALQIARNMENRRAEGMWLGNLGSAYSVLGNIHKSIECYEQALTIAREIGDHHSEEHALRVAGSVYSDLGDTNKAIKYYEEALAINRDANYQTATVVTMISLGKEWLYLSDKNIDKAIVFFQKSQIISDEISFLKGQSLSRKALSKAHLFQCDLANARDLIETTLLYDVSENNYNVNTLYGIISLRQGDGVTARQAFTRAIAQVDEILAKTPDYYSALDAKGLALSGLTICDLQLTIGARGRDELLSEAVEMFKQARKIAPHAGVVKSVVRLFDELVKCDTEGLLKGVREVIEATPLVK